MRKTFLKPKIWQIKKSMSSPKGARTRQGRMSQKCLALENETSIPVVFIQKSSYSKILVDC